MHIKVLQDERLKEMFSEITVQDVMQTSPPVASYDEDMSDIAELFITRHTSHICVVDAEERLIGLLSQKYLYKTRSPQKILPGEIVAGDRMTLIDGDTFFDRHTLNEYKLEDIIDKNVTTIHPLEPIARAIEVFVRLSNDCLVVVDQHRHVKGLLKENHVIQMLHQMIKE